MDRTNLASRAVLKLIPPSILTHFTVQRSGNFSLPLRGGRRQTTQSHWVNSKIWRLWGSARRLQGQCQPPVRRLPPTRPIQCIVLSVAVEQVAYNEDSANAVNSSYIPKLEITARSRIGGWRCGKGDNLCTGRQQG